MVHGLIYDIAGMMGATMVLLSYLLLQIRKLSSLSFSYSFINFTGSLLLIFSLSHSFNLASMFIEIFWLLISTYGLIQYTYKKCKIKHFF